MRRSVIAIASVLAALGLGVGIVVAAPPPSDPPQTSPPKEKPSDPTPPDTGTADTPPSLDELLGLEQDEESASAEEVAREEAEAELQRRLNEEEMGDAFAVVLDKMGRSAELLERRFDSGLGTQRVQEEVLAKLDQLIDLARRQPSSSSSSSSSGSSGSSSSQQSPGQGSSSSGQQQQQNNNSDPTESQPPAMQQGDINSEFEEARTEWGALPQRVRDMLLQGRREKFSSLYEQLTREYYRRLAEEGSS